MWIYVAAFLAAVSIGFGSGWQVRAWKAGADHAQELAQADRDAKVIASHVDTAAVDHETFKADAAAREHVVYKEVARVVEKPVYRNVCLDDDGLRILAADIAARRAASQPTPAVPSASAPR